MRNAYLRNILSLFFVILIFTSALNAQIVNSEIHKSVLQEFGVDTIKILENHFANIEIATKMEQDVKDTLLKISELDDSDPVNRNDIFATTIESLLKLIDVTRIYEESFEGIFEIYSERLSDFPITDFKKYSEINDNLEEALELSKNSKRELSKLTYGDPDSIIFGVIVETNTARYKVLNKMEKAFAVYVDTPKVVVAEVVIEPENKEWEWNIPLADTTQWDYNEQRDDFIIFRVQIIAVLTELSQERFDEFYKGYAEVYMEKTTKFYEYWVGSFFTYNEAKKYSKFYGGNSFVVAFKGNKRISVRKAIKETAISNLIQEEND